MGSPAAAPAGALARRLADGAHGPREAVAVAVLQPAAAAAAAGNAADKIAKGVERAAGTPEEAAAPRRVRVSARASSKP